MSHMTDDTSMMCGSESLAQSSASRRSTTLTMLGLLCSMKWGRGGLANFAGGAASTCLCYGNLEHHPRGAAVASEKRLRNKVTWTV